MKIFSKAIATGKEWKSCIECGKVFFEGEIIASFSNDNGCHCTYWYCSDCIKKFFSGPRLLSDDERGYIRNRIMREAETEKSLNGNRYMLFEFKAHFLN